MSRNQNYLWIGIEKPHKFITGTLNKLQFKFYRKPTSTETYILSDIIPISQHQTLISFIVCSFLNVPVINTDFNNEVNNINPTAINNGYSVSLVDNMIIKNLLPLHPIIFNSFTCKQRYMKWPIDQGRLE